MAEFRRDLCKLPHGQGETRSPVSASKGAELKTLRWKPHQQAWGKKPSESSGKMLASARWPYCNQMRTERRWIKVPPPKIEVATASSVRPICSGLHAILCHGIETGRVHGQQIVIFHAAMRFHQYATGMVAETVDAMSTVGAQTSRHAVLNAAYEKRYE